MAQTQWQQGKSKKSSNAITAAEATVFV